LAAAAATSALAAEPLLPVAAVLPAGVLLVDDALPELLELQALTASSAATAPATRNLFVLIAILAFLLAKWICWINR
jgi:hypothetical protein